MKRFYFSMLTGLFLLFNSPSVHAQDECDNAILLSDVNDYCSSKAAFTNSTATQSGFGAPGCWANNNNDVWFKFTAVATDVRIFVYGNIDGNGTLLSPEISLYTGSCSGTINEQGCISAAVGTNFISLYKAGLSIGTTYYIRIDGKNNYRGSFKLCVNNFSPLPQPGQDCNTATLLCNADKVSFDFKPGSGSNTSEANTSCLGSESASIWLKFVCSKAGTLTFVLTPTNPADDLDFVFYRLPNGVNNCNGKIEERCNAAGESFFPSPCMGPTGLKQGDGDITEDAGCIDFGDDGYCKEANLVVGQAYTLLVNNYSSSSNGFSVDFGGTASINALLADYGIVSSGNCGAVSMTFTDKSVNADTWNWVFGPGASVPTANTIGPHNVVFQPGTHTVVLTITNTATGCTDFKDTTFTIAGSSLDIVNTPTDPACGVADGQIKVTVTPGVAPYKFSKDAGVTYTAAQAGTTYTFTSLSAGSYTIKVEDANGCAVQKSVLLTSPNQPTLSSVTFTEENCTAGDATITVTISGGTPPYQYALDGGAPVSVAATTYTFTSVSGGAHTVTVKDNSICPQLSRNVPVTVKDNFSLSTTKTDASCGSNDGSITLTVNGGAGPYQFSKNNGSTFTGSPASPFTFSSLGPGSYDIVAIDANGCQETKNVSISNVDNLSVTSVTVTDELCVPVSGSIRAVISGGTTPYTWNINGTDIATNNNTTFTFGTLTGGNYTITVTDSKGCFETFARTVNGFPGISNLLLSATPQLCGDKQGKIRVQFAGGSAPFKISINNGTSFPYSGIAFRDYTVSGLDDGTYNVIVEDSKGCRANAPITLTALPFISNVVASKTDELCGQGNGGIVVTVTGGSPRYTYQLNANPAIKTAAAAFTFSNLIAGTYTITVNDSSGCPAIVKSVTINAVDNFSILSAKTEDAWCLSDNGKINISLSIGQGPYSYTINSGPIQSSAVASFSLTDLSPGVYTLQFTAANGCTEDTVLTVSRVAGIGTFALSVIDDKCTAGNGSIRADVTGGNPPYQFSVNGGTYSTSQASPFLLDNLVAGSYKIVVKDQFNCADSSTVTVGDTPGLRITDVDITDASCEQNNGSVLAEVTNPNTSATYAWTDESGNLLGDQPSLDSLPGGDYTFIAIDDIGCVDSQTIQVITTPVPVFAAIRDTLIIEGQSVLLELVGDTDGAIVWTPDSALTCSDCISPVASPDSSTVYVVSITNTFGCVSYDTLTILVKYLADAYVPSGFSPNGDGLNDVLFVNGKNVQEVTFFQVFNRWGEKVFEQRNFPPNDRSFGWDGVYRGADQNVDAYIYVIEALMKDGTVKTYKGVVAILR